MNTIYYLAYGSNLHPLRLSKRAPSAEVIGVVELADTMIVFHKRSVDGSGKCMLVTDRVSCPVSYGALFSMDAADLVSLNSAEGLGKGYLTQEVRCPVAGQAYSAFTYLAESHAVDSTLRPYHWYKDLVLAGARYHGFPDGYIATLSAVQSIHDPDSARRTANEEILAECSSKALGRRIR